MAWKLGRSYTSGTIHRVAVRISLSKLQPGDAVHTSGHVAIFVRWADRKRTKFLAMEESRSGKPALRRVRPLGHGATALRYRKITDPPAPVLAPPTPPAPSPDTTGSVQTSATASPSADTTRSGMVSRPVAVIEMAPGTTVADAAPTMNGLAVVPFF
jgi:hypothetical protein